MSKDHAIQVFNHPQFGNINTVETENGKVLFKGNDVAKALGYSDAPQAVRIHCKGVVVLTTPSENQYGTVVMLPTKYITEADVYRLVMRSKLPEAEKFQDWVCEEVLPSIRKHGGYLTDAALQRVVTEPDFLIGLANAIKEERKNRLEVEAKCEEQKLLIQLCGLGATMQGTARHYTNRAGLWNVGTENECHPARERHPVQGQQAMDFVCRLQGQGLCA